MMEAHATMLKELKIPLCIVANPTTGFHLVLLPHVKKLSLYSTTMPIHTTTGDGRVLDLGSAFPSLESVSMTTTALWDFGGEELSNALQIASTHPQLKHLELGMSRYLKARPRIPSITFNCLETLVLHSPQLKEAHLQLLTCVQWPALTLLAYQSNKVCPNVVPHLLIHASRLKWLKVSISSDPDFFAGVVSIFGQKSGQIFKEFAYSVGMCTRKELKTC
jgi:hypothetical protein